MGYTAGWITVPGKGKRWRTAEGEYLMQRPAGSQPGILQAIDRALGGWLPGGGTGNPLSKPVRQATQRATQAVQTAPRATAGALRDLMIVPAIDKGIEAGVIPAAQGMFVRYLSGTSKPMEAYPDKNKRAINAAMEDLMIAATRDKVGEILNSTDPGRIAFNKARADFYSYQKKMTDRAEMTSQAPTPAELEKLQGLENNYKGAMKQLGITEYIDPGPSREQSLQIIRDRNLADSSNISVSREGAYGGFLPEDVWRSLGRFNIRNGVITDRYKFDNLRLGRQQMIEGSVYPDALGGGQIASDMIEQALRLGIITPESGYDVRIPLREPRRQ